MKISGNLIDIFSREVYPAEILVNRGIITDVKRISYPVEYFILPGLIDSHIHIESSMVTPGSFASAAVSRGTTSVVSDPHEIGNVMGIEGVRYMIEDAAKVPLKYNFGAPSCVPATLFETSGDIIDRNGIESLMKMPEIKFLAEVMNYPGVINNDPEVLAKIEIAKKYKKPVDGHAPGLAGEDLKKYIAAGITTDHECTTIEEARAKINLGMKVLIREGSAARNLDALKQLIGTNPDMVMLCSDDLHPEMLMRRHIDKLVAKLLNEGFNLFDVIRTCTLNPARHYNLNAGLLKPGDPADFIIVRDYMTMELMETWINGVKVFGDEKVQFIYRGSDSVNKFNCSEIGKEDIKVSGRLGRMRVIEARDGELITGESSVETGDSESLDFDTESDILKIVVKERYNDSPPSVAFIRGFGLKAGAFASSIAHDSHNIICIGTNDRDIVTAVNKVVEMKGGLSVAMCSNIDSLQLNIGGIMSDQPVEKVAAAYEMLSKKVKILGCKMSAPFMTLSFMALPVIPALKLSDRGLFDVRQFRIVPLFL